MKGFLTSVEGATENEFEVQKWIFFDCFEKKRKRKNEKLIFMIMSSDV